MRRTSSLTGGLFGLTALCGTSMHASTPIAPANWTVVSSTHPVTSANLRAYGSVTVSFQQLQAPDKKNRVTVVRFVAEKAEKAETTLAKYLSDVTLSPGVKENQFKVQGRDFRLITAEGGQSFSGTVLGATAYLVVAPSQTVLQQFLAASPLFSAPTAKENPVAYPAYLDRFDRYGWGFYGFGGVVDFHNWKKLPSGGPDANPLDEMEFMAKYKFRFEQWLDFSVFDNAHGLPYQPEVGWMMREAKKRNLPYSVRLYGELPQSWEYGDAFERPADFIESGWYNADWKFRTLPHQSWYNQRGQQFLAWQAREQVKTFANDPSLQSWMNPIGEIGPNTWYELNGDFSPSATKSWRETLQRNGVTLEEASQMYGRAERPFPSWDQVPVPEFATFTGLPGLIQDLGGDWYARWADPKDAQEWWKADVQTPEWKVVHKPGSETWFNNDQRKRDLKWCIREFEVPGSKLPAGKPVYLYTFLRPADTARAYTTQPVYVNGELAGQVGRWGVLDVTKLIKPGHNRIAFQTDYFVGRVFLSQEKPAVYPNLLDNRNKLWILFKDWQLSGPFELSKTVLGGIRSADGDRPIKMMAPIGMGTDRWMELSTKYGAWPHFTGEGVWFFPWYKRYAYLYGVPGTSEGGGPPSNTAELQSLFQRIFLAGLDSHDQVFMTQQITRIPELKAWYEKHIAILKQLGRYEIAGPQVLIYRSTRAQQYSMVEPIPAVGSGEEVQSSWNWDIGRGTLQTSGHSYLYVDDGGVRDGKLNGYDVLIDGGNEVVTKESLDGIEEWVRSGGTYVTWPFTGKSSLANSGDWPITKLSGCGIGAIRKSGTGSVTVDAKQPYLKALAGQTFPDNGKSIDWQQGNHNQFSVELKPEAGSEILARFENGAPAIVARKLGAGRVITLGSAFFREAQDIRGIWWPSKLEATFFQDLLRGLGHESVNVTDDDKVWAQRYRMKNGLDDVVTLVNFADGARSVNLDVKLDRKPVAAYEIIGNDIRKIALSPTAKGYRVKTSSIPADEVALYVFRTSEDEDAVQFWWQEQQRIWKPVSPQPVDLSNVGHGRWGGYSKALNEGWLWSQKYDSDWTATSFDDKAWKPGALGIMNFEGADPKQPIALRKHFQIPADWTGKGGTISVVQAAFIGDVFSGGKKAGGRLLLNNQPLRDWGQANYFEYDITKLVNEGDNVLSLEIRPGDSQFLGAHGSTYLSYSEAPERRMPLVFQAADGDKKWPLPGKAPKTAEVIPQKIFFPLEWKEKYHVTVGLKGDKMSIMGVSLNYKVKRRFHHWYGTEAEVDLTPWINWGQENLVCPLRVGDAPWDISQLELRLYKRDSSE